MRPKPRNETKNANKVPINKAVTPLPYPVTFIFAKCDQIIRIPGNIPFGGRSRLTTKEKNAAHHNEKDRHVSQRSGLIRKY